MASDQQFCLRWNNHQSTLVSVFDNLLESQTLVDCTLAADGQYLKAHKVVLSACSPYLEAILCQNLDKHPILILKDVKFSELKAMLDYMYRGEVNISQEQLSTFLKAAESLQIKGLTDSGGGAGSSEPRERDLLKRQDLRKPLNQPVPHIPQPRPVVPHPGLLEPRRSLPHFPPHIADIQPQSPRLAREGSTSPTARKRRRPNRPSSDDSNFVSTPNSLSENQPDTSDSCDVPVKQSAPSTPSNVPNPSTKAQETDSPRTTPQPQINSDQKQVVVKKEFPEALLTPKTELDYGNDNSMEDVNYEDDEDEEVDLSKPGTSFATNNQGFPPWQMGGDVSNDDSNIYSPDVSATASQNNSQGCPGDSVYGIPGLNQGEELEHCFASAFCSVGYGPTDVYFSELNNSILKGENISGSLEEGLCLGKETDTLKRECLVSFPTGLGEESENRNSFESDEVVEVSRVKAKNRRGSKMKKGKLSKNKRCSVKVGLTHHNFDRKRAWIREKEQAKMQQINVGEKRLSSWGRERRPLVWSGDAFTTISPSSPSISVAHSEILSANATVSVKTETSCPTFISQKQVKTEPNQCKDVHNPGPYKCDICGREYMYLRGLRQHKSYSCEKEPQFFCEFCSHRCTYKHVLRLHIKNQHQEFFEQWYKENYDAQKE